MGHQGGLGVGGEGQLSDVALPHKGGEFLAEGLVDLVKHRFCGWKGLRQRTAHADFLASLAGKDECEGHVYPVSLFLAVPKAAPQRMQALEFWGGIGFTPALHSKVRSSGARNEPGQEGPSLAGFPALQCRIFELLGMKTWHYTSTS
jgi:hypothetical protein